MVSLIIIMCLSRYLNALGKQKISIMVHLWCFKSSVRKATTRCIVFREKKRNFQESLISCFSASKTFVTHTL